MAIINTYPTATPKGADLLIGTQVKDGTIEENSTKSFTVDALGSYIVTSTSGITGSGTLNTVAMFTPNGQAIGDSIITQDSGATSITIGGSLTTGGTTIKNSGTGLTLKSDTFPGGVEYTYLVFYTDPAASSSSISTPSSGGVVEIGQASGGFVQNLKVHGYNEIDQLRATTIRDGFGSTGSTFTGTNVLTVQNLFGQLQWEDSTDLVSGSIAKLIPFLTTASPGGSETYTALNNIVKIGWSGGNGTYVINLPSATAIPYRVIRFTTNGTYPGGGSHKVQITPLVGETIDGAAFFEISKVYEGIAVWSTGTEWVVIQAKAH